MVTGGRRRRLVRDNNCPLSISLKKERKFTCVSRVCEKLHFFPLFLETCCIVVEFRGVKCGASLFIIFKSRAKCVIRCESELKLILIVKYQYPIPFSLLLIPQFLWLRIKIMTRRIVTSESVPKNHDPLRFYFIFFPSKPK